MTRLSITTAPKGAVLSHSSPARRRGRAACQAQGGLLPKQLVAFGSRCYFPPALLLLLSLGLWKCPPVTVAQRGIVLPSLAQCLAGLCSPHNPHLKGPLQTSPLLVCLVTACPTPPWQTIPSAASRETGGNCLGHHRPDFPGETNTLREARVSCAPAVWPPLSTSQLCCPPGGRPAHPCPAPPTGCFAGGSLGGLERGPLHGDDPDVSQLPHGHSNHPVTG